MKKNIFAFFLCVALILTFACTAYAREAGVAGQGGLAPDERGMTNEEIINEALNDPNATAKDKQLILDKLRALDALEKGRTTRSTVKATNLIMPLIMQEEKTWCSAATIQQTLKKLTGSVGASQKTIMGVVLDGPGLQTVLNYVNARQTKNKFLRQYVSSQSDLDKKLQVLIDKNCPMIFTMKNETTSKEQWPYYTKGHFTNLSGKKTNGDYEICDPYFYRKYMGANYKYDSSRMDAEGLLHRTFNQIWKVNGWLFEGEGHIVGW